MGTGSEQRTDEAEGVAVSSISREEHELHDGEGNHVGPDPRWTKARQARHERLMREHMAGHKMISRWVATPDFDMLKAELGPSTGPLAIVEAPEVAVDEPTVEMPAEGEDGALDVAEENLEGRFGRHRGEIQPLPISKAIESLLQQGVDGRIIE